MYDDLRMWLIHPNEEMTAEFRERFSDLPNVEVLQKRFEELGPHDCFVTAANAFGMMTAGIDAAVIARFGEDLMKRIQFRIMDEYLGEQPVGTAFLIETDDADIPFLCHAPTMRVPGSIEDSNKVYTATWAAFLAIYAHNIRSERKIRTVAFPAFGAGFGGVPYSESARQMAAAYRHFLNPPHRIDWDWVASRNKSIRYDGRTQVVTR
mgnify:CR=1 FL=1